MLLGKPVVATDWSATTEFMDPTCAALVRFRLVRSRMQRGIYAVSGAEWAEADRGHAADWLRRLADDPDLRRTMGDAARGAALERLGNRITRESREQTWDTRFGKSSVSLPHFGQRSLTRVLPDR